MVEEQTTVKSTLQDQSFILNVTVVSSCEVIHLPDVLLMGPGLTKYPFAEQVHLSVIFSLA